jgi:hypothetical protein
MVLCFPYFADISNGLPSRASHLEPMSYMGQFVLRNIYVIGCYINLN